MSLLGKRDNFPIRIHLLNDSSFFMTGESAVVLIEMSRNMIIR